MDGRMMSSTRDETIFPKATPMITPTARSKTLPRIANSLNSLSTIYSPLQAVERFLRPPLGVLRPGSGCHSAGIIAKTSLWLFQNQDGAHDASHQQNQSGQHQKFCHPEERHARNRQQHSAKQHQRSAAIPLL